MRVEGFLDAFQELRADDAAAAPEQGDVAVFQRPVVLFGGGLKLHEALGVAANLRGVEGVPHGFDECLAIVDVDAGRCGEGPLRTFEARTRASFIADIARA